MRKALSVNICDELGGSRIIMCKAMAIEGLGRERFPRLNERGSIEASSLTFTGISERLFPRLNERGYIEAYRIVPPARF